MDEAIDTLGKELSHATTTQSFIVTKRLSIKKYDGISLGSKNSSSFTIDPPIPAAAELKAWFNNISEEEIQYFKDQKTGIFTKDLVVVGKMKRYTVLELAKETELGDYWVKGFMQPIEAGQQVYYVAFDRCNRKTRTTLGKTYYCMFCDTNVTAILKPHVMMEVADYTGIIQIEVVKNVAESILQTTAKYLTRLTNLDGMRYRLTYSRCSLVCLLRGICGPVVDSWKFVHVTLLLGHVWWLGSSQLFLPDVVVYFVMIVLLPYYSLVVEFW